MSKTKGTELEKLEAREGNLLRVKLSNNIAFSLKFNINYASKIFVWSIMKKEKKNLQICFIYFLAEQNHEVSGPYSINC